MVRSGDGSVRMKSGDWKHLPWPRGWIRPFVARWLLFGALKRPRPDYLLECWRFPRVEYAPESGINAGLPQGNHEPDLLFLPMTDWHARFQRTQHLACGLAEAGHRCFYVNPHLGFQFPGLCERPPRHAITRLAPRLFEFHARLPWEPVVHQRMPMSSETRILQDALLRLLEAAGVFRMVQIVSLPFWLDLCKRIRDLLGFPIVYDCHDWLGGFHRIGRSIVESEGELLRCCDAVLFSSKPLLDRMASAYPGLCEKALLLRNAASPAPRSYTNHAESGQRPSGTARVVGYIGALDHWFDFEAIRSAARLKPDWHFVLIGRIEDRRIESLTGLPNVRFLGEVPHRQIGEYIRRFDVGLIPFLKNELTEAANPIKLYEYFAYGLPVVSADLPEVRPFKDLVYLYQGAPDFLNALDAAAGESRLELRDRRIAAAAAETWENRVRALQDLLQHLIQQARLKTRSGPSSLQT